MEAGTGTGRRGTVSSMSFLRRWPSLGIDEVIGMRGSLRDAGTGIRGSVLVRTTGMRGRVPR